MHTIKVHTIYYKKLYITTVLLQQSMTIASARNLTVRIKRYQKKKHNRKLTFQVFRFGFVSIERLSVCEASIDHEYCASDIFSFVWSEKKNPVRYIVYCSSSSKRNRTASDYALRAITIDYRSVVVSIWFDLIKDA